MAMKSFREDKRRATHEAVFAPKLKMTEKLDKVEIKQPEPAKIDSFDPTKTLKTEKKNVSKLL